MPYANDDNISKGALLGFAQRLDMLFAERNESGIHAIGSYEQNYPGIKSGSAQHNSRTGFTVKPFGENVDELGNFEIDLNNLSAINKNGDIREYIETTLIPGYTT